MKRLLIILWLIQIEHNGQLYFYKRTDCLMGIFCSSPTYVLTPHEADAKVFEIYDDAAEARDEMPKGPGVLIRWKPQ